MTLAVFALAWKWWFQASANLTNDATLSGIQCNARLLTAYESSPPYGIHFSIYMRLHRALSISSSCCSTPCCVIPRFDSHWSSFHCPSNWRSHLSRTEVAGFALVEFKAVVIRTRQTWRNRAMTNGIGAKYANSRSKRRIKALRIFEVFYTRRNSWR